MPYENAVNTRLTDMLRQEGLTAEEEKNQPNRSRTDIVCRVNGHLIGIEAKQGINNTQKRKAIEDTDKNLNANICDVGIAIVYPDSLRFAEDLQNGNLIATVRVPGSPPPAMYVGAICVSETSRISCDRLQSNSDRQMLWQRKQRPQ